MSVQAPGTPARSLALPPLADSLVPPVAIIAVAVVSGGALEFSAGGRTMGINTAQVAALLVAILAARRVWRTGRLRVDALVVAMGVLGLVPILQALRVGTSPMAAGGIGRFATIGILLLALPQFVPDPPDPFAGTGSAVEEGRPWWRHWDSPLGLMGVALALLVLSKVVPALDDPGLAFYDLKDVVKLPLGNHNYVAAILVAAFALAVARPVRRSWWLGAAGVIALGLAATLSRGGWLVAGIVLVVLAVVRRDRATMVVVGALAGAAVLLLGIVVALGGPDRLGQVLSPATGARLDLWSASWDAFLDEPVLGVGVARFPEFIPAAVTVGRQPYLHAHNLFLETLTTTGVLGLLAYGGYWVGAVARVLRLGDVTMRWRLGLPLLALFLHAQIDSLNYLLIFEVVVATLVGVAACQPDAIGVREVRVGRRAAAD